MKEIRSMKIALVPPWVRGSTEFLNVGTELKAIRQLKGNFMDEGGHVKLAVAAGIMIVACIAVVGLGCYFLLRAPAEEEKWIKEGDLISGSYCDPEVVALPDGRYRMYYGITIEVHPGPAVIYSATSSDGLTWENDPGIRLSDGAMPSVVRLDNGDWRMYYSGFGGIRSAISEDGLAFTEEGVRIENHDDIQVRSSTVIRLDNGSWRMYYCEDSLYIRSSISNDGLIWVKESGTRIDGTVAPFYGLEGGTIDGPDIVRLSDGSFRLYFWSGRSPGSQVQKTDGIYSADSEDGLNFSNISLVMAGDEQGVPSDPSVIQMGNVWRMYYGMYDKICSAKTTSL